jgi:hypothetical protein
VTQRHAVSLALALLTLSPHLLAASGDETSPADSTAPKQRRAKSTTASKGEGPGEGDRSYSHGGQLSLRAGLVGGYRMVFRYDSSPFCVSPAQNAGRDPQRLCGFSPPLGLDLGLGFSPFGAVEPFAWARFGFTAEEPTNTNPLSVLGAGLRVYTRSDDAFKIFLEPAIGLELEGGGGNPAWNTGSIDYKKDLLIHIAAGPQLDLAPGVGLYADAGLTVGILRAISSTMELQFGVQVRAP